jgi:hypothetical protein
MKKVLIIGALTILFSFTSCLKEKGIEVVDALDFPCGDTVYFQTTIMGEIINAHCTGCHTGGGSLGGYSFDSYSEVVAASTQILSTIKHETSPMPQGGAKLNDSLITKFDCWIQQGKLNN